VTAGVFSILLGTVLQQSFESGLTSLAVVATGNAILLWLSSSLSSYLCQSFYTGRNRRHRNFSKEAFLCLLLARGWPGTFLICGIMGFSLSAFFASGAMIDQNAVSVSIHFSSFLLFTGASETIRRYLLGRILHLSLYQAFGHKLQRVLQRISALRAISQFARKSDKGGSPVVHVECCRDGHLDVGIDELIAFEKVLSCLRSNNALSKEFGSVATRKDRRHSACTLYNSMATQGILHVSTLFDAASGNAFLQTIIRNMFPCGPKGIVSQTDFSCSVESLHKSVTALVRSIQNEYVQYLKTSSEHTCNSIMSHIHLTFCYFQDCVASHCRCRFRYAYSYYGHMFRDWSITRPTHGIWGCCSITPCRYFKVF
jgi:hypothetical protein